ncbi:MAG: hypothetical protein WCJ01_10035 [Ignavibacteria bacterium]
MLPIIIIVVINLLGFLLKSYGLDRHLIFTGFRFHISCVLPVLLFIFKKEYFDEIKEDLLHPKQREYFLTFLFITIPAVVLLSVLYLMRLLDMADPDYFYELGITSIIDYPVYLFWNFPQLLILTAFLSASARTFRFRFPVILGCLILLFAFEFIPEKQAAFPVMDAVNMASAAILFAVFLTAIKNLYLFVAVVFSVTWINILLFGSRSGLLVNLFLARNYNQWDGFFEVSKAYSQYIIPAQIVITLLLFIISFVIRLKKFPADKAVAGNKIISVSK